MARIHFHPNRYSFYFPDRNDRSRNDRIACVQTSPFPREARKRRGLHAGYDRSERSLRSYGNVPSDASISASTRALISPWKRAWRKHKHKHQNILILMLALMIASNVKTEDKAVILKEFLNRKRLAQKIIFYSYCAVFCPPGGGEYSLI